MKKKAIEKIPYLTLPNVSRKKGVEYIGVTACKTVGSERHLFLEVYRNGRREKGIPAVRIVMNKNDLAAYFPETGAWSSGKITPAIWQEEYEQRHACRDDMEKGNRLYSREDLERLRTFTGKTVWRDESWWDYIEKWRQDTAREKYEKSKAAR